MKIYVPSSNRADRCELFNSIDPLICTLVVPFGQGMAYREKQRAHVLETPPEITGIRDTRNYLLRLGGKMVMMDDDLRFFTRANPGCKYQENRILRKSTKQDIADMLMALDKALDTHAHASISPRAFNNALDDEPAVYGRYYRLCGFNTDLMPNGPIQALLAVGEDLELAIQLYKLGLPAQIFSMWAHDDVRGTSSSGGCSTYRTHELHEACILRMEELYAPFVKAVRKVRKTKTASGDGFENRLDPKINWKALYEFGQQNRKQA